MGKIYSLLASLLRTFNNYNKGEFQILWELAFEDSEDDWRALWILRHETVFWESAIRVSATFWIYIGFTLSIMRNM
jgi:hypothetical protein